MGFLDKLKFWKPKETTPASDAAAVTGAAPTPSLLIEAEPLLSALAEREVFNRDAALATDSFHQRDKHNDRADEDAWIAAEIRKAMK